MFLATSFVLWASALSGEVFKDEYSNSTDNFKRPKNREDSSDFDDNLTESIAAQRNFHLKKFSAPLDFQKYGFDLFFVRVAVNVHRCKV